MVFQHVVCHLIVKVAGQSAGDGNDSDEDNDDNADVCAEVMMTPASDNNAGHCRVGIEK